MYVASVDHDVSSAGGKIGEPIVVVVSQVRLGTPPEQKKSKCMWPQWTMMQVLLVGKIGEPIVVVVSQVRLGTPPEQKIEDAVCGFLHRACQYLAVKNVIFFAISP
jgi:hypothetical protein